MDVLGVNAKLGDGCLSKSSDSSNVRAIYNGKNVQWIGFKRDLAIKLGFDVSPLKPSYSGYKENWSLVQFSTKTDSRLTEIDRMDRLDVIKSLRKIDLLLWYIDDGSWHKSRKTMHLYCNDLNQEELDELILVIEKLYSIKPTQRADKKKDGRSYPYLYFPRALDIKFKRDMFRFLKWNGLETLYYKVGETSETIRKE